MKLNWISWGEAGAKQKPSVGGVWIFSETAHFLVNDSRKLNVTCILVRTHIQYILIEPPTGANNRNNN